MDFRELVEQTPFVDTHEHLVEEAFRVAKRVDGTFVRASDWTCLLRQYLGDDLRTAGMPERDYDFVFSSDAKADEKAKTLLPFWARTRHTGYARAVRLTMQRLYGESDITHESAPRIADKYADLVRPGFYRSILRTHSNVDRCHINSLDRPFVVSSQPDILCYDLSILAFTRVSHVDIDMLKSDSGSEISNLPDWLAIIDEFFQRCGPNAVAVKSQIAYDRRLDHRAATFEEADPIFRRHLRREPMTEEDLRSVQDFLVYYCLEKATEFSLPVKLHTGYQAGHGRMDLQRVRKNASDLVPLIQAFPDTKFILMHMGYSYQHEYVALAKHYRNVFIDMCWAWIISPIGGVQFLKEFILAAPHAKILIFGGDYIIAETICGHAEIARRGLVQALTELTNEYWLNAEEAADLVPRLMNGNALEMFHSGRKT